MEKYKRRISTKTLKPLLARSGNQCAYPDCSHPIFDDDSLFIAQLCHIEAVSPNGQRYNSNKTNEEINSYDNLLFLCYRHHKVTDNVNLYTVHKLKEIKTNHEAKFKDNSYNYPSEVLINLEKEIEIFWNHVDKLQTDHIIPKLAVLINAKNNILTLVNEINEYIEHLSEVSAILMNDCKSTHFEYVSISLPNLLTRISIAIDQIEIKYLEEQVQKKPYDKELKDKLDEIRNKFKNLAGSVGLSD
ncbi:MAG: hypothetical protein KAZ91_01980 [Candidatus Fonsibacter sp.]|nr:hypothetical protein [Candidatus Fonsibacter sp.]